MCVAARASAPLAMLSSPLKKRRALASTPAALRRMHSAAGGPAAAADAAAAAAASTASSSSGFQCEDPSEYAVDAYLWKFGLQRKYLVRDPLAAQQAAAAAAAAAEAVDGGSVGGGSGWSVTPRMRRTVLSWLVSVCRQFGFTLETWCLSASILDRFTSVRPLARECLQLAGLAAFFVAAKAEEVDPPDISELVSLCAHCYEVRQFR